MDHLGRRRLGRRNRRRRRLQRTRRSGARAVKRVSRRVRVMDEGEYVEEGMGRISG